MRKIGFILGLLASILTIIGTSLMLSEVISYEQRIIEVYGISYQEVGFNSSFYLVNFFITFLIGLLGLLSSYFNWKEIMNGNYILILLGIFGLIGMLIPIFPQITHNPSSDTTLVFGPIYLAYFAPNFVPFLFIGGGVLGWYRIRSMEKN
jgi:tellurite resistance protein TehA-like permease